ncbi:MAG: adenylate/guanylate cyclase domain-containing protein, partial [Spirochaetota bacterium]
VKDLKELHTFCNNQADIYAFNNDLEGAVANIKMSISKELKGQRSIAFGVKMEGDIFFSESKTVEMKKFEDKGALQKLQEARATGREGTLLFRYNNMVFFGVYKYNENWNVVLVRAEELNEFYSDSWRIFQNISIIIILITILCVGIGIFLNRFILRFVGVITSSLMKMQESQSIDLIDLSKAPNDDITYLGMSFNALSSTISNLMTIFRKFVATDIAVKAYREKEVRLEGSPMRLAVLFSDIKGFTYMTETLGTDIINLLNMHYDKAIYHIREEEGDIGSIIGDALLAVFGTLEGTEKDKSLRAIRSAYKIQEVASGLREEMTQRREEIIKKQGALSSEEEKIYKAVLIEVGVGIDGGEVFYGTIGSRERMANTVIGDNVNSASRLEGLTRIYRVPVVCSAYIRNEVEGQTDSYYFQELDKVQVKGKTEGKLIYWPIPKENLDNDFKKKLDLFAQGLGLYYKGKWSDAHTKFKSCGLPLSEVFQQRTKDSRCPKGWNGIWTMTTK